MKPLSIRDLPIRRKLTLVIVGTSVVALLLAAAAFGTYEYVSYRRSLVRDVSTLAAAIGYTSHGALLFDDETTAERMLQALAAEPSILSAEIYTSDGRQLASYGGAPATRDTISHRLTGNGHRYMAGRLDLRQMIVFDGDTLGTIRVQADLRDVNARLVGFSWIASLVLLGSTLFSFLLSSRLAGLVEGRLLYQANFDHLTDLPNRLLATDRLSGALVWARRHGEAVALVFIDLDQFKVVNDTLGHAAGDELLVQAAHRLTVCVRDIDTVARLGGDEFVLILTEATENANPEAVSKRVLASLAKPFRIRGKDVFVGASIGIATYPSDGEDPQTLFQNADAAMYQAKEEGRNVYRFFAPEMNERVAKRLEMESHLRRAMEHDELTLFYQPLLCASSGEIVGAEALLRWQNPELGTVPPLEFIPLAEETGLILPIGEWVLATACKQMGDWQAEFGLLLRIAVNVSSRQLREPDLVKRVGRALEESGLPPHCLELEITEHMLIHDLDTTAVVLNQLVARGTRLSLDDFGTGYSALSYLKKYPFDALKIDRSFMRGVTANQPDASLVTAIIVMAHSLGLEVIGEGVETEDQLEFLRSNGCDVVQGFHFGRPMPANAFRKLLHEATARPGLRLEESEAGSSHIQ